MLMRSARNALKCKNFSNLSKPIKGNNLKRGFAAEKKVDDTNTTDTLLLTFSAPHETLLNRKPVEMVTVPGELLFIFRIMISTASFNYIYFRNHRSFLFNK